MGGGKFYWKVELDFQLNGCHKSLSLLFQFSHLQREEVSSSISDSLNFQVSRTFLGNTEESEECQELCLWAHFLSPQLRGDHKTTLGYCVAQGKLPAFQKQPDSRHSDQPHTKVRILCNSFPLRF